MGSHLSPYSGAAPPRRRARQAVERYPRSNERRPTGYCAPARAGKTCRSASRRTRPATAGSSNGSSRACSGGCSKPWPKTCASAASSTLRNASLTARSWPQKRGRRRGKDQAGQGHEAHGGGRPRWSSCLRPHFVCFAAWSHPCRGDSRPGLYRRTARAADRGQGLRLRPARRGAGRRGH
jgi:hypothetical protein